MKSTRTLQFAKLFQKERLHVPARLNGLQDILIRRHDVLLNSHTWRQHYLDVFNEVGKLLI
jgi:hypothetical protein